MKNNYDFIKYILIFVIKFRTIIIKIFSGIKVFGFYSNDKKI